jgi:hypothetical protein
MDEYHGFKISIQINEKLQGNFATITTANTFAVGAAITTTTKATQKKSHKLLKKQLLDRFYILQTFCGAIL